MKAILPILLFFFSLPCFAGVTAEIVTFSKTVASAATPEALTATKTFSKNIIIQAKSGNSSDLSIGPCSGTQNIVLTAGTSLTLSDIVSTSVPAVIDLNTICVDVGTNGDGVDVLHTKIVTK